MNLFRATLLSVAILTPLTTFAHEAPIRVVVLGEDSDRNAVSRSSEIYTRNTVFGVCVLGHGIGRCVADTVL